ncbi:MAG: LysE family translocator [Proteobacteria bacterium]|nr:LysE family translocator [Pseudomonadota bacterium]
MPETANLLAFVAASALLGITPGPDILYVVMRGAAQGPRAGLAAAAGLCTGIVGHIALCAAGLSAIIAGSATAFTVIKIAGAAWLIWLGIAMWRARGGIDPGAEPPARPLTGIYRQSIVMNLLNPKVALFFLAFLPQFVTPDGAPVALQLTVLGLIFMAVSFIIMGAAGLAGGQVRRLLACNERAGRWLERGAGTVLIALGIRLAIQNP